MKKKWQSQFILLLLLGTGVFIWAQNQDSLEYEVTVKAMVVPVFAVDGKGNPIHDLKQDELRLFVNGKPSKIAFFTRYDFAHEEEVTEKI